MGVVQAKPSQSSSSRGFDKLKQENGYVGKGEFMADRRSTGQRDAHRESAGRHRPQSRKQNGGEGEGKLANMGKRVDVGGNGENVSQKTSVFKRIEEAELVDGWPKWLVDNVPREVLSGIVPKSVESYVMFSKVCVCMCVQFLFLFIVSNINGWSDIC
jgi:cyclin-dependent kinase 12/13